MDSELLDHQGSPRSLLGISQQGISSMLSMLVSGRKAVGDFGVSFITHACIFQILNLVYVNNALKNPFED